MSDDTASTIATSTTTAAEAGPDLDRPDYWQRPNASVAERRATPADWRPEFEGQRAPVGPSNTLALVSGYKSPRAIEAEAHAVRAEMIEADPALDQPRHRFAVESAAWSVAETRLLRRHVATVGVFDAKGNPRSALLDRLAASERRQTRNLAAIGFDPTSEARLRRDQSVAVAYSAPELLAARMAEGRALVEAAPMPALRTTDREPAVDDSTTDREDDHA